jgi:hypothetical protein
MAGTAITNNSRACCSPPLGLRLGRRVIRRPRRRSLRRFPRHLRRSHATIAIRGTKSSAVPSRRRTVSTWRAIIDSRRNPTPPVQYFHYRPPPPLNDRVDITLTGAMVRIQRHVRRYCE